MKLKALPKKQSWSGIPDEMWEVVKDLLPHEKREGTVGRPQTANRVILDGILYKLITGCQWKKIPGEYGSGSTCHERFQVWVEAGIFQQLWKRCLEYYDKCKGIKWQWQSLDSITVKSPKGGLRPVQILQTEGKWAPSDTF